MVPLLFARKVILEESQQPITEMVIAEEGAFDKENPRSLYNLVPPSIQEHLIRSQNHFLNDLSAESKRKNIQHCPEYKLARKIRTSFWIEYDNALAAGRQMHMTRVWQGVVSSSGEFYRLFKKDHLAVFIFTKPVKKEIQERSLLALAYDQIEDILSAPHLNKDGTLNAFSAKVKIDVWKHLDERVNGGVIKNVAVRSEVKQTNTNVNIEATGKDVIEFKRAEQLQEKLAELREQTKDIEAEAFVIDEEDVY